MRGRPAPTEAAPYYFRYIDQVSGDDALARIEEQAGEVLKLCEGISEERSLHRYGPDKWSIRQVLNHVNDSERALSLVSRVGIGY